MKDLTEKLKMICREMRALKTRDDVQADMDTQFTRYRDCVRKLAYNQKKL